MSDFEMAAQDSPLNLKRTVSPVNINCDDTPPTKRQSVTTLSPNSDVSSNASRFSPIDTRLYDVEALNNAAKSHMDATREISHMLHMRATHFRERWREHKLQQRRASPEPPITPSQKRARIRSFAIDDILRSQETGKDNFFI